MKQVYVATHCKLHIGEKEIKQEGDRKSTESSATKNILLSNRRQGRTIISRIPSANMDVNTNVEEREREREKVKKKEKLEYKNV